MVDIMGLNGKFGTGAVGTNVRLGFAAVFLLLFASAGVSLVNTYLLHENTKLLAKNVEIQDALNDILSTMQDVEIGQRGYVLTGDKEFLEPYHRASLRIQPQIDRLRKLLSTGPEQQASVKSLENKIAVRLAIAKVSNALREEKGMQAAHEFVATGQGKRAMEEVRSQVAEMATPYHESQLILEIQGARTFYITLIAEALVALLGLGLVGMAFQLVRRESAAHYRTLESLHEQRERLRVTLASIGDAVIVTDEHGVIMSLNPVAETLTGWNQDAVGQKLADVFHIISEATRELSESPVSKVIREGIAVGLGNHTLLIARDGKEISIDDSAAPIRDGQGNIDGVVLVFRDITVRKGLEEKLRERVEQLHEADRRKNEFLAMLAHELRNPLAPVQNAVNLLRKNCPTDPDTQWAHDVIERQVQHMTRMVDDLLDVSRITRGLIELRKEPIEITTAVTRAVEMTQPLINARQHQLIVALPPESLRLDADPPRLVQILANLLNNAAKYTEVGGTIWLTVERQGTDVLVKVRDTGIGIPPEYLPHVFDLFSQEDTSLERTQGGLGIGLTLVRILVKMHGGDIQAFSAGSGQGSEFVLRLPALAHDDTQQSSALVPERPAAVTKPLRILVVDDNVDGAKSLSILLKSEGHEVQTAHDGHAALEIARQAPLDVVLLDIGMPHMSGLEVARRLRGELGLTHVLLVAMTGYGQDADRQCSQEAGFNVHMVKPLDLEALQAILARSAAEYTAQNSMS